MYYIYTIKYIVITLPHLGLCVHYELATTGRSATV